MGATLIVNQDESAIFAPPQAVEGEVFAALLTQAERAVYRLALRLTGNPADAEDVRQETLLKAYAKRDQFIGGEDGNPEQFSAWVMRIARHEAIKLLRKRYSALRSREVPLEDFVVSEASAPPDQEPPDGGETPEEVYFHTEALQLLAEALAQLGPNLRSVCVLHDVHEFSTEEIARCLGISTAAVRLRRFRARLKPRARLHGFFERPAMAKNRPGASPYALPGVACGD